jgi:hypothetical protein
MQVEDVSVEGSSTLKRGAKAEVAIGHHREGHLEQLSAMHFHRCNGSIGAWATDSALASRRHDLHGNAAREISYRHGELRENAKLCLERWQKEKACWIIVCVMHTIFRSDEHACL